LLCLEICSGKLIGHCYRQRNYGKMTDGRRPKTKEDSKKKKRVEEEWSSPQSRGENRTDLTVEAHSCMNLGKETVDCSSGCECHMALAG
jgi:hypothetical protein